MAGVHGFVSAWSYNLASRCASATNYEATPISEPARPVEALDTSAARASPLLRGWRLLRLVLHLLEGLLAVLAYYPFVAHSSRQRMRQRWSRRLLRLLGIELLMQGAPLEPGSLLVANHVSWLDIFVVNALVPSAFVSKSEVRDWPLIGWLAARNDTVFLRRGSRGHARIVNAEIATLLEADHNVAVFPEGTTSDGTQVLHFHAALLQPAIECGRPIQPLSLRYQGPDGRISLAPAYIGDMSLGQSILTIIAAPRLVARVEIFAPIPTDAGRHRREVANDARDAVIAGVLGQLEKAPDDNAST